MPIKARILYKKELNDQVIYVPVALKTSDEKFVEIDEWQSTEAFQILDEKSFCDIALLQETLSSPSLLNSLGSLPNDPHYSRSLVRLDRLKKFVKKTKHKAEKILNQSVRQDYLEKEAFEGIEFLKRWVRKIDVISLLWHEAQGIENGFKEDDFFVYFQLSHTTLEI